MRLLKDKATSRNTTRGTDNPAEGTQLLRPDTSARIATAEEWRKTARAHLREGDAEAALAAWQKALQSDLRDLSAVHQIGEELREIGRNPIAFAELSWTVTQLGQGSPSPMHGRPPLPSDWRSACLAVLDENWSAALPFVRDEHERWPRSRQVARNLCLVLEKMGQPGQAQCVMAATLHARGSYRESAQMFLAAPEADATSSAYLATMLSTLRSAGEGLRASEIAERAHRDGRCPADACIQWAETLLDTHRYEEAYDVLQEGASRHGKSWPRLQAALMLPAVPASQEVMERAHERAHRALHELSSTGPIQTNRPAEELDEPLVPSFYLGYLGRPCVNEIRAYGQYVGAVASAFSRQHNVNVSARKNPSETRIRIGYASAFAQVHTVWRHFSGWLEHADRQTFELHLFPLDGDRDWMTGYLTTLVDYCHPHVKTWRAATEQIQDAQLDVLVYSDIGMDWLTLHLAAQRLAPVQCVAYGHPVTTGLDTIDFFISNDSMEPDDAASHYTERLVSLPGTGVCMPRARLSSALKSRHDYGLPSDSVIYLATQSLFKFLPKYDQVFASIAERVESSLFLFVESDYPAWTRTFRMRMEQCFQARGLDPARHIRFLPKQPLDDYFSLNAISDIFLDPIGWSGGMTAFDALSFELPMVVLPGALMRGRQSYGMLKLIGIEDTIAKDVDDYVQIAVKLGLDPEWRRSVSSRIVERRHLLFDDTSCVKSLEAFYRWAAGAPRPEDPSMFKLWPQPPETRGL